MINYAPQLLTHMQRKIERIPLEKLYKMRDRIDLTPEYQRTKVWGTKKMQLLMDTILRDMDIPKFYLWDLGDQNFECVDGQQRFRAIFGFYDDVFPLSETESSGYPGKSFHELPSEIQNRINKYKIDVVKLTDASEYDVARMFDRLQRGVTTNTAEKLNAILGGMRDFVKTLPKHSFFSKIAITKKRMSHNHMGAQITLISLEGPHNLKFKDLEKMYRDYMNFDMNSPKAAEIKDVLDYLDRVFTKETSYIRNRATVASLFWFVLSGREKFPLTGKEKMVRAFFKEFHEELHSQIRLGKDATDAELLSYQTAVIQAADTKDSIKRRDSILANRFEKFLTSLKTKSEGS